MTKAQVIGRLFCLAMIVLLTGGVASQRALGDVVLEKMVCREHPAFGETGRWLNVGRDGRVYVIGGVYVLRMNSDGTGKMGIDAGRGTRAVAADTKGMFAVAHSTRRVSKVTLWNPKFDHVGTVADFLANTSTDWGAPFDVQSGPSGTFYATDQHRNRIVHIAMPGGVIGTYSLEDSGVDFVKSEPSFRVVEALKRFYITKWDNKLHVIGFDGKSIRTIEVKLTYTSDAFDVDDQGNVYVLNSDSDTIKVFTPDGKEAAPIKLQMGKPTGKAAMEYASLRLLGDDVFVKRDYRASRTELFQVYDRKSGALKRIVHSDFDSAKVQFPSAVWTAGEAIPVTISMKAGGKLSSPSWPVQIALYNDPQWTDLAVVDGKITPLADASGLYQVRVGYGEYKLSTVVEIRRPGSKGTISIMTPRNRLYYGRGEEIPLKVYVRGNGVNVAGNISLLLQDRQSGTEVLRLGAGDIKWAGNVGSASISKATSAKLRPGRYMLTTTVDGLTVAPQPLVIGPGLRTRPVFNIVEGGDGTAPSAPEDAIENPLKVAWYAQRAQKTGVNMVMERLGSGRPDLLGKTGDDVVAKQLEKDPAGIAPEKAALESLGQQSIAANGAYSIEEQAILMYMDSVLPLLPEGQPNPGGAYSSFYLSYLQKTIEVYSSLLSEYPAYRGWSWACNWWIFKDNVLKDEKKEWENLREKVIETGKWDPRIEVLSDRWISLIPETDKALNATLQKVAPGKINSVTGPYRAPGLIPPVTFKYAGEVDLFLQAEQIQMPFNTPHNVDFYKRPGKRAFGHPESHNEDGTGAMVPSIALQQLARGADGTGWEGRLPHGAPTGRRGTSTIGMDNDPRSTGQGRMTVFRALSSILRQYGPWLTTLEGNDHVAIVASTRMLRLEEWEGNLGGRYFKRLLDAYLTCLYAHRPASYVFTEDLEDDTLKKYKAVLVVGQLVELDPPLAKALADAQAADVHVFYDGTSRQEFVDKFKPLNIAFDGVEKDHHPMNDDTAYNRFAERYRKQSAELNKVIGSIVPPVAKVDNPEIMLTERINGEGRFVWALNNDQCDWDPGLLWRVGMFMLTKMPQAVPIDLNSKGQTVYELFAMKEHKGNVIVDLRRVPARLFAVLPKPIESVSLTAAGQINAGDDISWTAAINGPKMTYPLRAQLIDGDGKVIEEIFPVGTSGKITVPINSGPKLTLEVMELISGKKASKAVAVSSGIAVKGASEPLRTHTEPVLEKLFGPHLRDLAVSQDGATVLINAMNWDDNYYILDTASGAVRKQGSVGHQYTYAPIARDKGFFLQGYDVTTAEGYHLYDMGAEGKATRRFALYGVPERWQIWRGSGILTDRINNFVVSPKGGWIASTGNLGLIVWSGEGKKLWSQDWWTNSRQEMFVLAPTEDTLIAMVGMTITAYNPLTGKQLWQVELAESGINEGGVTSSDGRTVAVYSHIESGRVYIIRDGKLLHTLPLMADNLYLTPDGRFLGAMVAGTELRWYSINGELQWSFRGDAPLIGPKISPDGKKILVGTQMGTLYVIDDNGKQVFERDFGAVPAATWLPGGEMLVATWMGDVIRLDAKGGQKWFTRVEPKGESRLVTAPVAETLPTFRATWGDASEDKTPLTPNLLAQTDAVLRFVGFEPPYRDYGLQNPNGMLTDGSPKPPSEPLVGWTTINLIQSGWFLAMALEVETKSPVRLTALTFVEDPAFPQSWLRDMRMQVWDTDSKAWVDGPYLLSNSAVHTHKLAKPLVGSKFRFIGSRSGTWEWRWPLGSIRLGEMVFHGQVLPQQGEEKKK